MPGAYRRQGTVRTELDMGDILVKTVSIRDRNITESPAAIAGKFDGIRRAAKAVKAEIQSTVIVDKCRWPRARLSQITHIKDHMFGDHIYNCK